MATDRAPARGGRMRALVVYAFIAIVACCGPAHAGRPQAGMLADQPFLDVYRELVETNTQLSDGDCTLAAQRMSARLEAAGFAKTDLHLLVEPDHPREGSLVAILRSSRAEARPMLLLAHIDVVEAQASEWRHPPFRLTRDGDYFYGRGSNDDKAMAAIWVDILARLKRNRTPIHRDIKLALTCGEEAEGAFNGAGWLARHHHDLIDADFALNEGGAGYTDAAGRRQYLGIEVEEKLRQNYLVTAEGTGGHSSMPVPDNAIVKLASALARMKDFHFPVRLDTVTRNYLREMARIAEPAQAEALSRFLDDPTEQAALDRISANPLWNATVRTTCVPTLLSAGKASNALPAKASATINCRILPTESRETVLRLLSERLSGSGATVTMADGEQAESAGQSPVPVVDDMVTTTLRRLAARYYPGLPVIPMLVVGSTDAAELAKGGIATFGVPAFFYEPDFGRIHGIDERIKVADLMEGRDFLYDLVLDLGNLNQSALLKR